MSDRFGEFEDGTADDSAVVRTDYGSLTGWLVVVGLFLLAGWLWYVAAGTYVSWYAGAQPANTGSDSVDTIRSDGQIPGRKPGEMAVVFFSVGDGDGILVQSPDNYTTLIDGGEGSTPQNENIPPYDWAYELYLPFFEAIGLEELNRIINTLPVSHHMGSQPDLVAHPQIDVGEVLVNGFPARHYAYRRLQAEVESHDVPMKELERHQTYELGDAVKARVLQVDSEAIIPQDSSAVIFLQYGDVRFLLMSDLPQKPAEEPGGESELALTYGENLNTEVMKIGGQHTFEEKNTTSQEILGMANPETAVISTDRQSPRPFDSLFKRLEKAGIRGENVLRTDKKGHIAFYTDGEDLRVTTGAFSFLE